MFTSRGRCFFVPPVMTFIMQNQPIPSIFNLNCNFNHSYYSAGLLLLPGIWVCEMEKSSPKSPYLSLNITTKNPCRSDSQKYYMNTVENRFVQSATLWWNIDKNYCLTSTFLLQNMNKSSWNVTTPDSIRQMLHADKLKCWSKTTKWVWFKWMFVESARKTWFKLV